MSEQEGRVGVKGPQIANTPETTQAQLELPAWAPDASALWRASHEALPVGLDAPGQLEALGRLAGCPSLELVPTAMSARASLMGLSAGRAFYHHELRVRLPMPEGLEPEQQVWAAGGAQPHWAGGILEEPKYFSFFQDAPLPAYNPNYRRKWRAHELLHGAVGFFWHPEQTRFELYLAARYNELLPVIHWYGLDEVARPRCPKHQLNPSYRDHCAACEQAIDAPFWAQPTHDEAWGVAQAQRALDHLFEEWAALEAERVQGRRHASPRLGLDSSSDAIGYLRGHWRRTTAWSFGQWVELFMTPGLDYEETINAYAARVARTFGQWVSGDVSLSMERAQAMRARRQLQDLGYRALLILESLDERSPRTGQLEQRCFEVLEAMSHRAQSLGTGLTTAGAPDDELAAELVACFEAQRQHVGGDLVEALPALGLTWQPVKPAASLELLRQGLESALPMTLEQSGLELDLELVARFVESAQFGELGPLAKRFAQYIEEADECGQLAQGWAALEAWLQGLGQADEEAEDFAVLPELVSELERGQLRLNATADRCLVQRWLVEALLGPEALEAAGVDEHQPEVELMAARFRQEVRLLVVDEIMALNLEQIEDGLRPSHLELVMSLLDEGVVIWSLEPAGRVIPDQT